MYLTRHQTEDGACWAADGNWLPQGVNLRVLLTLGADSLGAALQAWRTPTKARSPLLAPLDPYHEVWGSGVTYLRSREAREAESNVADVYQRVYEAERPELFFKALGWRVRGHEQSVHIRSDATWNVPEPELTLVINAHAEIVGYTVGNDLSARDLEGENPLYLPQAKTYNGSCAIGPGIRLASAPELMDLPIHLTVLRQGREVVNDATSTSQMKRRLDALVAYLFREMDFPEGVLLMTGTGIVPDDDFSLTSGDVMRIRVGSLLLENSLS